MLAATSGPKRKAQSSHPLRPLKQHRTTSFDKMLASDDAADRLSDKGGSDDAGSDSEAVLVGDVPQSLDWQKTIDRVVGSVVAIRFCQPCSFDTDRAMGSEASGFIVDAEKGYILTNRHVVGAGPFWGYCIFDNHEEAETFAVYRDPIHDFGILRFDPKAIKYMKLEAIDLRPDLAQVGLDIRVVGNDAGEKLSILTGIISRLDRNAPVYEEGYSDFNTCYYQANASASGGSSGSPVVNKQGHAIALQAGGREDATTDYFLPLDRPLRALQCIREGKPVTRGDIQCQFYLKPFDECRRLGLTSTWEASVRAAFPDATNMLVAEVVLPDGPAHHKIEEGDVLVQVNGELLTDFIRLDDILDSNVSNRIKLLLQRGGENVDVEIEVGDLHEITPDRFVSVGGGSFHNLSYHQARNHAVACKGVYVCETAGSWLVENDTGWIIQSIDKRKTPDLATFVEVLRTIPDKARIVVTFQYLRDMHKVNTAVIQLDRHWWAEMRMAVRNDVTGRWDFTDLGAALPPAKAVTRSASFVMVENASHPAIADLVRSFVQVDCVLPMKLDGFPKTRRWGMGLVIDAEQGLVLVSRAIVPYDLCDITIVVADSIQVEAKVVFLHPLQNWTVVRYDPSLVDAPVLSAKLGDEPLTQGQAITFVGFNKLGRIVHTATTVTEITAVVIPANTVAPRYRALNLDAITIDTNLGLVCGSGVLVDPKGTVQAVWLTYLADRNMCTQRDEEYHLGLNTSTLLPVVNQIKQGLDPKLRILSVEFRAIPMSQARVMSVSEEWIGKAVAANKTIHQLFMVSKSAFERGDDKPALLAGDIILTLNGKIISTVSDLDVMYNHDVLDALIVRDGQELQVQAPTVSAEDVETDHAVMFCGALFHRPHHAVRQQISTLHSEIYISAQTQGSPASQYGLSPTNFITHVNSVKTTDLKSFLVEVTKIPDNTYFRLKAMTFDSVPWVITMKKNDHYFPTVEWIKDKSEACGWRRVMIGGEKTDNGAAYSAPTPMEEC